MLDYWKSYEDNDCIYSCDNIRINFELREDGNDAVDRLLNNIDRVDIESYPPKFTAFNYKYMYVINYLDSSMRIGISLNGLNRDDNFKGFLEFNPNKTMCGRMLKDIEIIRDNCFSFCVSRYDIAVDIPIDSRYVRLHKDKRKYTLIENSCTDKTEYLGERGNGGRVKLYNKTMEYCQKHSLKKESYDTLPAITRLEITFDSVSIIELNKIYKKYVPELYISDPQLELDLKSELSSTHLLLAQLIKNSDSPDYYLRQIENHSTRKKIKDYVYQSNKSFNFSYDCLCYLVNDIIELVKPF